jgi:hypothetical protein
MPQLGAHWIQSIGPEMIPEIHVYGHEPTLRVRVIGGNSTEGQDGNTCPQACREIPLS